MGKRSTFERRPQDAYDTPPEAVVPLLPHLPDAFNFWEPCAGRGALISAITTRGNYFASDLEPRREGIGRGDALKMNAPALATLIITNPPWTRSILHPMIEHFRSMRPTWLLFDADWMHTRQAAPFLPYCHKIVSVGRVKWMPDSPHTGKDNAAWYLFDREPADTVFVGRDTPPARQIGGRRA